MAVKGQQSIAQPRPVKVADRKRALAIAKKVSERDKELLKRLAR